MFVNHFSNVYYGVLFAVFALLSVGITSQIIDFLICCDRINKIQNGKQATHMEKKESTRVQKGYMTLAVKSMKVDGHLKLHCTCDCSRNPCKNSVSQFHFPDKNKLLSAKIHKNSFPTKSTARNLKRLRNA